MKTINIPYSKSEEKVLYEIVNKIVHNTSKLGTIHSKSQLLKRLTPELADEILSEIESGEDIELNY